MWIRRISVQRYGPLEDVNLSLPPRGVIPIYGPNEIGKSSLVEVVRTVLFGYERGQASAFQTSGARLELVTDDGDTLWVERKNKKVMVRDSSGVEHGEDGLAMALMGTTRGIFRNVYAFGLSELQEVSSLKGGQVGAQLLSTGLGTRANLTAVLDSLAAERDKLYVPKGRNKPVNIALKEWDAIDRAVREAERAEGQWASLIQQEEARRAEADAMRTAVQDLMTQERALQRLADQWEAWERYQEATVALLGLEEVPDLPPHVRQAWDRASTQLERDQEELQARLRDLADVEARFPSPAVQAALKDPAWNALIDRWPDVRRRWDGWNHDREVLAQADQDVNTLAMRLGVDPEDEWPGRALQLAAGLEEWGARLESAELRRDDIDRRLAKAEETAGRRRQQADEINRQSAERDARLAPLAWVGGGVGVLALAAAALPSPVSWVAGVLALLGAIALMRVLAPGRGAAVGTRPLVAEDEGADSVAALTAERDRAARAVADCAEQFAAYWGRAGLPALTVAKARELTAQADYWAEVKSRQIRARASLAASEAVVEGFWAEVARLAPTWGLSSARDAAAWDRWSDDRRLVEQLTDQRDRAAKAVAKAQAAVAHDEAEVAGWLEQAGVLYPEQFLDVVLQHERRETLRSEVKALGAQLAAAVQAAMPDHEGPFDEVLRTWTRETLAEARASLQREREAQATVRDATIEDAARLRARREDLERSGTLAELRWQQESLRDQIQRQALQWLEWEWTATALAHARDQLRRERQPAVIQDTARLFRDMTQGRYSTLWATEDEDLSVQTPKGVVYRADQLSRGAKEQLYLAFRLGWIQEQARRGRRMPMLLDDVLVNADHARQRIMADVLLEFAEEHQVLYFTCHPEVLTLWKDRGAREVQNLVSPAAVV